jgi:L-arabinonolactonase
LNFNSQPTRILDLNNHLGESPLWSAEEQALYWVNCEQPPELHRWSFGSGAHDKWLMPLRIGGLVLRRGGRVTVALADGIYDFDPTSETLSLRVKSPLPEYVKLHECQCDRQGRLWVGSYDHHFTSTNRDAKGGSFFRLDGDTLTAAIGGVSVSNGLAFSPDGRVLYATDSPTRLIEAFDLDPASGTLSRRRPFTSLPQGEGFPDGATVDAEGGYWLAAVSVGTLRRHRADGSLDRVISLPFSNPTKPAFGGPGLDIVFVTSTMLKFGASSGEGNGGVYGLKVGAQGVPESLLAG